MKRLADRTDEERDLDVFRRALGRARENGFDGIDHMLYTTPDGRIRFVAVRSWHPLAVVGRELFE